MNRLPARPALALLAALAALLVIAGVTYAVTGRDTPSSAPPPAESAAAALESPTVIVIESPSPPAAATAVPATALPTPVPPTEAPKPTAPAPPLPTSAPPVAPTVVAVAPPPPVPLGTSACPTGALSADVLAARGGLPMSSFPGGATASSGSLYQLGSQLWVRGADGCFTSPSAAAVFICNDGAVLVQAAADCAGHGGIQRRIDLGR